MKQRKLLTRSAGVATRERVYRVEHGLEVDEIDHFEIRRWRVLFDDVVLLTVHHHRGAMFLTVVGLLLLAALALCYFLWRQEPLAGWILAGLLALPLALVFLARAIFGKTVVNVYSRRSQATLPFMSAANARRVAAELTTEIEARQRAAEPAAEKLPDMPAEMPPDAPV